MITNQFVRSLLESMAAYIVNRVLATNRRTAIMRRWSMIIIGGLLWAFLAYAAHPYTSNLEIPRNFLEYPFRALFAADVFKHVFAGAVAFWLAYRVAAIYLDDIFELNNVRVTERFIRQSTFGSRYDLIEIKNGAVDEKYKDSPIILIGGPGKVRVYLENAALFEKIDGQPHVIGPTLPKTSQEVPGELAEETSHLRRWFKRLVSLLSGENGESSPDADGTCVLESFERLRSIIDLRDQVETMTVFGRTRDGIPIQATDLRVIFSILRDGQTPTLKQPYPFSPQAFETLVYTMPRRALIPEISYQINRWLWRFIARHTLSEFLAAIGQPEVGDISARRREGNQAIEQPGSQNPNGGNAASAAPPVPGPPFNPRPEIRDLFYDYNNFVRKAREKGVELRWIGLGTWVLPNSIIPERHIHAWRITQENLIRGSQASLAGLRQESRAERLSVIIRECPLERARELNLRDEAAWKANMAHLTQGYIGKLQTALDIYASRQQTDREEARRLRLVWQYLTSQAGRYLS